MVGRGGQSDAVSSVRRLAAQSNRPQYLGAIGAIGVLGSFILLTFYAIAGWVSAYFLKSLGGQLHTLTADNSGPLFDGLLASSGQMIFHQILLCPAWRDCPTRPLYRP